MRFLVLDRYIARELVSPFAFGCALFTFFLVIDRIYHLTDLVVTKGVPFPLVVQLLVYMLPSFLAHTLPMALLIAVLLAGGRLASDLEITAFKAAGVSALRLFRPVLGASLLVTLLTAGLTLFVNPAANGEFQRQLFRIVQVRAVSALQERVFNDTFGGLTIYVEDVSASQMALRGLLVSNERDPTLSRIITAREGRLLTDELNRSITLRLMNGAVNEADVLPADPPRDFITKDVPTAGGAASSARYRYTSFDIYDMSLSMDSPLQNALRVEKPEKDLTLAELGAKIAEYRNDPHGRAPFQIERHKRYALPLAALVFGLVAFPLAIRSHRGGRSIALVGSLAILVTYYLVMTSLEGAALNTRIPSAVAIWAPNVLLTIVGLGLLVATAREWRWPAMPGVWRGLEALRRAVPSRPLWRRRRGPGEARDSTHIIDRYLVRQYVTFMGIGLAVAAALFVVIDLVKTLDKYLRVKPPLMYILEHFAYRLPAALHDGLPVVMLVATIFLFLTLSRYHELTALKAAGVSLYRLSAPILGLALVVAIGSGLFQELALPRLNERGDEVDRVKIRGQAPRHLQSRHRLWVRGGDSRFYRVELLHPGTEDMYGVTLLELDREFRLVERLDARWAHWTTQGWELSEGAYRRISADGKVQTVPFGWTALDLKEEMEDIMRIQKSVSTMSFWELRDYIGQLKAAGFEVRKDLVELYSKLSFPLVNVVMVLVAIPFALQSPRGERLFGIGLAIAIMAGYLVVHYVALAFARADLLPPLIAAWSANVIFMGIGASLLLRART
ncbi:MAG: LPS export ABC transporter permease LptG [Candidatus Rokuibacteriota bacterium]|nr:MAG: LPS export ABC transporter permease LptG [Candidatus Rokubacteria bacterium]